MKSISASSIRGYEREVKALEEYNKTIEMGFQIVMHSEAAKIQATRPAEGRAYLGAVIFGSDQGLCGNFNEQIASFAVDKMEEISHQKRRALAVGERVISRLEERGQSIEVSFSFYGKHLGITEVMMDVLVKIEEWRLQGQIDQIVLFYNRPSLDMAFSPHMAYLFPLDIGWLRSLEEKKWESRILPTFFMDVDQLFSSLVRHYLFLSLYRAFIESLASENASRLQSMQRAEKNLEEHLGELNMQFYRQRQAAIMSELLDVVTGFEALTSNR
jgi:F-type H+-transporting ATPase subunit gamma